MANPTMEELKAQLAKLHEENEKLKAQAQAKLTLKVSEKGGVSLYGLGRYPVTLYAPGWLKLIGMGETIKAFIETNKAKLSWEKPQEKPQA